MKSVTVGTVTFGEGRPKIIVPIVGRTEEEIVAAAQEAKLLDCDVIEWRIDFYDKVTEKEKVAKLSHIVHDTVQKPLLVTFRTKKEGGEIEIPDEQYFAIYHELLQNGYADLIDVELFMEEQSVQQLIQQAQKHNVKVVMCNHDFDATPAKDEIVKRLQSMQDKGADILKIAVMPKNNEDVLTLLEATREMYAVAEQPLITMSMGALGAVSRLSGEVFGSSATFGAAKKASAPGQIPVEQLRSILNVLALS